MVKKVKASESGGATTAKTVATRPRKLSDKGMRKKNGLELGRAGTESFHGFISEDFNSDFHGLKAIKIFDEMRKTDGTVAAVLKALKLPIRAAEFSIQPVDAEDATEVAIAEFVRKNLFENLQGGFDGFL